MPCKLTIEVSGSKEPDTPQSLMHLDDDSKSVKICSVTLSQ